MRNETSFAGNTTLMQDISYPDIEEGFQPRHSFMSAYEQKIERPDKNFQYILFAADPYETIGFKIPNWPIVKDIDSPYALFTKWDATRLKFTLQLTFEVQPKAPPT